MHELLIAVIGGILVLTVQGAVVLARQWRARVHAGEVTASRLYVTLRRAWLLPHRRSIHSTIRRAAEIQRNAIEAQYAQDPLWKLGQIRLTTAGVGGEPGLERAELAMLLRTKQSGQGLLVRGESGAGKSSLAAWTAHQSDDSMLLLRFDLADYDVNFPFIEQASRDLLAAKELEGALGLGNVALILDGLESLASEDERKAFDRELGRLIRRFPGVPFAVLARPEAPATRTLLRCTQLFVSPLTESDARQAMAAMGVNEALLLDELHDRVRPLTTSPLALRMLLQAYSTSGGVPNNQGQLYRDFVLALVDDPNPPVSALAGLTGQAKLDVLAHLALAANNESPVIDVPAALALIRPKLVELASRYLVPATMDAQEVLQGLVADGVLRTNGKTLRFVHYSVQEFFMALALHGKLLSHELDLANVVNRSVQPSDQNSIVFLSGLLSDSTELVSALRHKNRVLSAECIKTASQIDPSLVDKCIVEALYEFKFGRMSFNYELVFALMLIADRRSPDLPERILSEMQYWCTKYASRPLHELSEIDNEALLALLRSPTPGPQASDAIWTLSCRSCEDASPLLEDFLRKREAPLDHVSALCLGRLKSRQSAQLLLSIALDENEPDPLRSSCFNSIGMIGSKECLPAVMDFLRSGAEADGTVRENAAWSLIGLVDEFLIANRDFQRFLVEQLDVGLSYSRAMFAYLCGRFRISTGFDRLLSLVVEPGVEPLLLEDVVFALGEFADKRSLPTLMQLLYHSDSVVRARVVEALSKTPGAPREALASIASSEEQSEIVRDSAREAIARLSAEPRNVSTLPIGIDDLRKRR